MSLRSIVYFPRKVFSRRFMATFTSRQNIVTGENEWIFVDDEQFDYQQELARSAFADMLHDDERNVQYEKAIRKTLENLSKTSDKIHLLDIGTGTGLLSMIAARVWKEGQRHPSSSFRLTACEVFQPMANIAKKCIEKNDFHSIIRVIDKRSTELDLIEDFQGDRINAIVAEVFDTELIGEGALRTFAEACQHLTVDQNNLRIIPARATIYVQLVQSKLLDEFHRLKDLHSTSNRLKIPDDCRNLAGNSIFDLNLNEIAEQIQPLTKPIAVFAFDFKNVDSSKNFVEEKILENILCERRGEIDAIIMWWNLDMDEDGEIQLGTTPIWCVEQSNSDEKKKSIQWREHWIHGIYYPQQRRSVESNEKISLYCFHDEYSLYFDVGNEPFRPRSYPPSILSRSAISAFNSDQRREKFLSALDKSFRQSIPSRCLYIGDGLLLPFLLFERYPQIELLIFQSTNSHLTRTIEAILKNSSTDLKYRFVSSLDESSSVDWIISEPFFTKSILPWDNLHLYYLLRQCSSNSFQLFPRKVRFRCIALEFEHLHKIRSPVRHCLGFDLSPFDEQIMQAALQVDAPIEPQPLFEYSSKRPRLSTIIDLFQFDLRENDRNRILKQTIDIPIENDGICNGLAFWIDYELAEDLWLTTGIDNADDSWVTYSKQGVHLLVKPLKVQRGMKLSIDVAFDFQHGDFRFQWSSSDNIQSD